MLHVLDFYYGKTPCLDCCLDLQWLQNKPSQNSVAGDNNDWVFFRFCGLTPWCQLGHSWSKKGLYRLSGALVLIVGWGHRSISISPHEVLLSRAFTHPPQDSLDFPTPWLLGHKGANWELLVLLRPRPGTVSHLLHFVGQSKSQGQHGHKDGGCTFRHQDCPVFTEKGGRVGSLIFRQTTSREHPEPGFAKGHFVASAGRALTPCRNGVTGWG